MAQEELDKFSAGQLDDVSQEAALILTDKEIVLAALTTSHDAHVSVIDSWEESVVSHERKLFQLSMAGARSESVARDRMRILEVVNVTAQNNREIEELDMNVE